MSLYKLFNNVQMGEVSEAKSIPIISDHRYNRAMVRITLLRTMNEIDNNEVKRLISQLESPDHENWTVAEECIKQKLAV